MSTRYWLGAAVAVPQATYIQLGGTYSAGDKITLTIPSSGNGKDLILTVGSTTTIDQILDDLVDMVNGASANNDETRSALGNEVGEWAQITATNDKTNDYLILTGKDDGQPFTVSYSTDSSAGTITVPASDPSISPESPHDFANKDNWSGNTVPVTGDTIVFDYQATEALKYGLSQTGVAPAKIVIDSTFTKSIGLPAVNKDDTTYTYNEYRERFLTFSGTSNLTLDIDSSNAGNIRIDTGTLVVSGNIRGSGSSSETDVPPIQLVCNSSSNTLTVVDSSVGYCSDHGDTGAASSIDVSGSRSSVEIGDGVTLTTLSVSGGSVVCESAITTVNVYGGELETKGTGTITTVNIDGGTFIPGSTGTVTTITVGSGGVVDNSKTLSSKTFTNISLYAGSMYKDPYGTITATNGLDVYCKLTELTLDLPARKTYTLTAI